MNDDGTSRHRHVWNRSGQLDEVEHDRRSSSQSAYTQLNSDHKTHGNNISDTFFTNSPDKSEVEVFAHVVSTKFVLTTCFR